MYVCQVLNVLLQIANKLGLSNKKKNYLSGSEILIFVRASAHEAEITIYIYISSNTSALKLFIHT
jgi:hypothetical protein